MLRPEDVAHLACPDCRGPLAFAGQTRRGLLHEGELRCGGCQMRWPVEDGFGRLYREERVRGNDRLLRYLYDGLPALHDPMVRYTLPLVQSATEEETRQRYLPRLELEALCPREDGEPVRLLEVGIGAGANLPLVRGALPAGLRVELWGADLSLGMLRVLRRQMGDEAPQLRLLAADAHALPFRDGFFDRVFNIGGVGGYRDPAKALAEMARVAIAGTPLVVVDEQLDSGRRHSLYHRLMFRLVTFYEPHPHAPVEHLPPGATDVLSEQISRFFYCLRFRVPGAPREPRPAAPRGA